MRVIGGGRVLVHMTVVIAVAGGAVMQAAPASALDQSSIRVSAMAVNAGTPIGVEVFNVFLAKTCVLQLVGPRSGEAKTVRVRSWTVKTRLDTAGMTPGSYAVRVSCGKTERATSTPFFIVAPTEASLATCDVTEYGFSPGADGRTSYGIKVTNRSLVLSATSVRLAIAFFDAAGNTLATTTEYVMDIGPGESVFAGGNNWIEPVARLRIDAVCDSSTQAPLPRLRGIAQSITPRDSRIYPISLASTFSNPFPYTISDGSTIAYITRNQAGTITGGGWVSPDAFIPAGATGTWSTLNVLYPSAVASVEWVMDPRQL